MIYYNLTAANTKAIEEIIEPKDTPNVWSYNNYQEEEGYYNPDNEYVHFS